MTRKTTTELKESLKFWRSLAIFCIFMIVSMIAIIVISNCGEKLRVCNSQLQECQENMPVWALTYTCHYPDFNYNNTVTMDFNSEREYQIHIKHLSKASAKHCEVLE